MKISILIILFSLVTLSATPLGFLQSTKSYFIVWNVGQGQWASWINPESCTHFDMGGEHLPAKKLKSLCRLKTNYIYISHWDWDHISFAGRARRLFPQACVALAPLGKSSARKMKMLAAFESCPAPTKNISSLLPVAKGKDSNDLSHVLLLQKKILIPGDSPKKQEKIWSQHPSLKTVRWLLLGHHGSRTSTSAELLGKLPHLKIAIASARFKKYGHPHGEVLVRLKNQKVPVLRTEDWGHLWFELETN